MKVADVLQCLWQALPFGCYTLKNCVIAIFLNVILQRSMRISYMYILQYSVAENIFVNFLGQRFQRGSQNWRRFVYSIARIQVCLLCFLTLLRILFLLKAVEKGELAMLYWNDSTTEVVWDNDRMWSCAEMLQQTFLCLWKKAIKCEISSMCAMEILCNPVFVRNDKNYKACTYKAI